MYSSGPGERSTTAAGAAAVLCGLKLRRPASRTPLQAEFTRPLPRKIFQAQALGSRVSQLATGIAAATALCQNDDETGCLSLRPAFKVTPPPYGTKRCGAGTYVRQDADSNDCKGDETVSARADDRPVRLYELVCVCSSTRYS